MLLAAGVSTIQSLDMTTDFGTRPFGVARDPESVPHAVVADLERARITHLYAHYWVAYVVDLLSDGAVTATPPDAVRSRHILHAVSSSARPAWLFTGPSALDERLVLSNLNSAADPYDLTPAEFTGVLRHGHVGWSQVAVGPMVAVVPARRVTPRGLYTLETRGHL